MTITKEKGREILSKMLLTRKFEEQVIRLFEESRLHGTMHPYVGEEAVAAGVCCALEKEDLIESTHRGHGHCISKGSDVKRMMAELLGKENGYCKGKGGSMHIADFEAGNLGANGIVGGGQALAVGAALTTQMKKIDRIVVCFFGDGASNEGSFHESLNLASVWKLPVLFVCEDNKYGMSCSKNRSMNITDISTRAESYGMKGVTVDGMDAVKVYEAAREARGYVRANGPMLLVCDTYRYLGHSKSDTNVYRTEEEIELWKQNDAIERFEKYLIKQNLFALEEIKQMERDTSRAIKEAVEFAQSSACPVIDDIESDVYA